MNHETEVLREAERMAPLIRSIAQEVQARNSEIVRLESVLGTLLTGPGEPIHEIRRIEEELFRHRRELEGVQKELAQLGCSLDAAHPGRILCARDDSEVSFEERLDETGYRPDRSSPQA
jgi:hypothetical protein